jgi:hypothetical protein
MNAPSVNPPASEQEWEARTLAYWNSDLGRAETAFTAACLASERATLDACKAWAEQSRAAAAFLRAGQANSHWQAQRQALAEWSRQRMDDNAHA